MGALSRNKQKHFTCLLAMTSQAHGPCLYARMLIDVLLNKFKMLQDLTSKDCIKV